VLEIVAPHEGDTYRAAYTVKFTDAIYVLHAFQKKSKSAVATPKTETNLIRQRLAVAQSSTRKAAATCSPIWACPTRTRSC
jgi:phage-related protein